MCIAWPHAKSELTPPFWRATKLIFGKKPADECGLWLTTADRKIGKAHFNYKSIRNAGVFRPYGVQGCFGVAEKRTVNASEVRYFWKVFSVQYLCSIVYEQFQSRLWCTLIVLAMKSLCSRANNNICSCSSGASFTTHLLDLDRFRFTKIYTTMDQNDKPTF